MLLGNGGVHILHYERKKWYRLRIRKLYGAGTGYGESLMLSVRGGERIPIV
jgi:hypothetical protein